LERRRRFTAITAVASLVAVLPRWPIAVTVPSPRRAALVAVAVSGAAIPRLSLTRTPALPVFRPRTVMVAL